ncbi:Na(+)-translocating NADH-quinone reductase subunit A [Roseibium denhamense]|uniref:Na(+)-translocating NADH-quinone reductase subunit A n=1 Tax=Roseibium denhamense TaxID=76305 RepID=A0ABY1NGW0_9HYPH|nr:Na(+)-translocating NADH-quinone reductase subunit A [Roseibium denhamense]MTI06384.1 Na(+)-translocating NADH-quinone reductase subunit A [Roseibium denhamense]SMP08705.1 Na+-transporting NADH:ubiquinone oxidoreductase subunit A [Roseibium denhamense]
MQSFKLKKGLDLPVAGVPVQEISEGRPVKTAAVIAADYIGLKPRLVVEEGDAVGIGSPLFFHKDTPDVMVTSPVTGRIKAINRGARRVLISVEIEIDGTASEPVDFSNTGDRNEANGLVERLCASGLWTSFRTRPYSKVPDPEARPAALYVTAMDTEPLTAEPQVVIAENSSAFEKGLDAIKGLSKGPTYLCCETGADIPGLEMDGIEVAGFSGPHPAGLAGTHIHFLNVPTAEKTVWTIGYQDVIAIGRLLETGTCDPSRVIALSGPRCTNPRLVRTIAGASMEELCEGEIDGDEPVRLISGSILSGRMGEGPSAYLGRYARQITVIEEDHKQIPMGWIRPMPSKFALQPVLGSAFSKKLYALTSNLNGGRRAMVPIGTFEQLMPQDFLPTQLLRALLVMDTDEAQALGALELDEEDLGLVGFACPAKYEYGIALRDCLTKIEKEG